MTAHSFAAFAERSEFASHRRYATARHYLTLWPRAALKNRLGHRMRRFHGGSDQLALRLQSQQLEYSNLGAGLLGQAGYSVDDLYTSPESEGAARLKTVPEGGATRLILHKGGCDLPAPRLLNLRHRRVESFWEVFAVL